MDLQGKILGGRYEISEKIGNGGMAIVYKAKDHVLNRNVAVKILKDEFTTDEEFVKKFNTEAQSIASLAHHNIVSVYDVGKQDELYYIVMGLINGKTLKEIILEDGPLPWKWSVSVAVQIASALELAHKNNIVHRDIKPHNIIITEDGIAKVTDFGIAKAVSNSTITTFGTTIGSVHYFSPEQAKGGYTDGRSDLYSLGIILYEMLTGKVPFDADTPVSVALKHMQEEAREPILLNPAIPSSINKIIIKAMQKDINQRYQTAGEIIKDLNMALKDPDGDFVVLSKLDNDFPTQRMPNIYDKTLEERIKERDIEKGKHAEPSSDTKGQGKQKKEKKPKGVGMFILMYVGPVILLLLVVLGIYFAAKVLKPKQVLLPELVGMTQEEAEEIVKGLKIDLEIKSGEYSDTVEEGFIISQDPPYAENYRVREGSKVKIVVSKGAKVVTMPKLVGLTKAQAIAALESLELEYEERYETNDKVEKDYVIRQTPTENLEISATTIVTIFISDGMAKATVPNLIGKTEAEARAMITERKLVLNTVKYEEDSSKPNGTVIKQDLEADKEVNEGAKITITVNKLPEIKKGVVNINLKNLTGYVEKRDENNNIITPDKVELSVKVNDDTVYKQKQAENAENIAVNVEGVGTVTIKVYVDGVLKKQSQFSLTSNGVTLVI